MNLRHCLYLSPADHEQPPPFDSDSSTGSSLNTSVSLQTLPSIPSLSLSTTTHHHNISHSSPLQPPPLTLPPASPSPSISALALSGYLLYVASGHIIHVYDTHSLLHLHSFNADNPSSGSVKSITFSSNKVFTAHQDSKIRVWKLTPSSTSSKTHRLIAVLPTITDRLLRLPLPSNYVQVRRHKKQLWLLHNDAVSCLGTTNNINNGLIYSVSWDKSLKIWRTSDFKCIQSLPAHDDAINAVTVSQDGVIYTGSADKRIRVWAKLPGDKKHALIATLQKHKSSVNALALSSDGKVLFSGACDRSILVWEREDTADYMVVTGALRGHSDAILCVVNVNDFLLSGSADRTVRIWRRGIDGLYSCLTVLEGHLKPVKSLVASSDDDVQRHHHEDYKTSVTTTLTVFSGSLDGEIRVWKVNVSSNNSYLSSNVCL